MKNLKEAVSSKSKKSSSKAATKNKFDDSGRPRLRKDMKYRIDKVQNHPLHILSLCNRGFTEDIKSYFGEDVLGYSFKNLQPTSKEVRTLDLSFSEDFQIFNLISVASTSVAPTLKRSGDEDQSRIVTTDDHYDDFTTRPTQEFLRKARLASPLSTEQASRRRKIVMFQEANPAATDGDKSTSAHLVRHVSEEIGVSPEREKLKFVPPFSTTPEGTSKSNVDME
ncbi:hypothetical protein FXO38_04492 [Capsicum annuum]|nr:hypothetical protein FXO38_04492 [Capsicum annuum]